MDLVQLEGDSGRVLLICLATHLEQLDELTVFYGGALVVAYLVF